MKKLFILNIILLIMLIISCSKTIFFPENKEVIITIDDAPAFPENTIKMLNVLKRHNVQATFFCIGQYIENDNLHLADSIAKYNILANHTYSHPHLNEKSLSENYEKEILYNQTIIDSLNILYNKPLNNYFRAPYSAITDSQQDSLIMRGFKMCWWDSDASDWDPNVPVNEIVSHHITYINDHDKTILIFHLSNNSVTALDEILIYCKQNNIKITNKL